MIPKGLKPGDIFIDHARKYKVLSVNPDGTYVSSYVSEEEKVKNDVVSSEQNGEAEEETPRQNEDSQESYEKKYTKTQIRRMKKDELDLLCAERGIDAEDTDAKREALIDILGV